MISVKEILVEKFDSRNYEQCVDSLNFHFQNSFTTFNPATFEPSTIIPFSVKIENEKYLSRLFFPPNQKNNRDYIFNKLLLEVNQKFIKEFIKNKKEINSKLFNTLEIEGKDLNKTFDLKEMFFEFLDIKKELLPSIIENFVKVSDVECRDCYQNLVSYKLKTEMDDELLLDGYKSNEKEESLFTKILGEIIIMFLNEKENDSRLESFGIYEFFISPRIVDPHNPFAGRRGIMVRILKQYK